MMSFLKRNKSPEKSAPSLVSRLTQGLKRTRQQLGESIANLVLGKKTIDAALLEEIESLLIQADLGVVVTEEIIKELTAKVSRKELTDGSALFTTLKTHLVSLLLPRQQALTVEVTNKPCVILVVGVNGAGKTTTIGKLAKRFQTQGKRVMLAAGDTFRAAAIEQLKEWGQRNDITVISQHTGADSASVIYDALQAAQARDIDVLIADTAGRLHTQTNLMEELKKIKRVLGKLDQEAPHQVMLVLDASIGQNAIRQTQEFNTAVGVTGICLTKLDGTAKAGVIFAIAKQFTAPIYFIGLGEGIDDLRPFVAEEFVDALFDEKK